MMLTAAPGRLLAKLAVPVGFGMLSTFLF